MGVRASLLYQAEYEKARFREVARIGNKRTTEKQLCSSRLPHTLQVSAAGNLSLAHLITQRTVALGQRE